MKVNLELLKSFSDVVCLPCYRSLDNSDVFQARKRDEDRTRSGQVSFIAKVCVRKRLSQQRMPHVQRQHRVAWIFG